MRFSNVFPVAIVSVITCILLSGSEGPQYAGTRKPVLVELFTSEGCSSCPPADAFLSKLDQQPLAAAQLVVLSEHVDYWDHLGWQDPYSNHSYSLRQEAYAGRFGSRRVYTPQIVVDGTYEFVGGSARSGNDAFAQALNAPKIPVHLSSIRLDRANILSAHVEADAIPPSHNSEGADVYITVALNRAESHVARGENGGRILAHTAVVRTLSKIGSLRSGESFAHDVQLKVEPGTDSRNLRLIAFLQEPHQGKVVGAAMELVDASLSTGGK